MVTPPSDQAIALVQQMMPQIETAYAAQDWLTVVDKMAFLVRRIPATLPPGLYRMQAEALLAEGQPEQARAALDAALALDHLDVSTLQLAAHVRNRLGQYAEAVPLLQDALAVANNSAQRLALLRDYVQALIGEKQWSEALRRCEEAQRLAPNDATLSAVQLQLLSEVHRDADALTLARTLTARPDATLDWWLARARLARSVANDTTEVQTALDAAVRLAPNNPAVSQARHDLLPPPIAPDRFPQRLASFGFTGHTTQVNGKLVEYIVPPLCEVPAGPFLMGSDPKRDKLFARYAKDDWAKIEAPQHSVTLPAFAIARYPVTVAEYACFVRTGQREPEQWQEQLTKLDHPVGYISWWDATAYVVWLAERTGQSWHLPNEAEWEKAARGTDGRLYPWGDTFEKSRCNINVSGIGNTTPVGTYPSGASPYGVQDLAGNVWEWASDPYQKYPYKVTDFDQNTRSNANRIVRGGSNGLVTLLSMHVYLIEASGRPTSMLGVPDSA